MSNTTYRVIVEALVSHPSGVDKWESEYTQFIHGNDEVVHRVARAVNNLTKGLVLKEITE